MYRPRFVDGNVQCRCSGLDRFQQDSSTCSGNVSRATARLPEVTPILSSNISKPIAIRLHRPRAPWTTDAGLWSRRIHSSTIGTQRKLTVSPNCLEIGISKRIGLRLGGNYEVGGEGASVSGGSGVDHRDSGELVHESQLLYGAKLRLTEQDSWLPESSVIAQGHTPTSGPDPATAFSMGYVFGWELANEWKLDSAIRFEADKEGADRFEAWATSLALRKSINDRWNVHAEYFGINSQNRTDNYSHHYVSPGIHYLLTPNLEIATRIGWGMNNETPGFFSNTGISCQF